MKCLGLLLVAMALEGPPLRADTLYQINAQGQQVVIQRDAILVKEDSSALVYKHFELKERRVVKVRLNKGSLAYSVVTSSSSGRQQIVDTWKRFGYTAAVKDETGKTTRVFDGFVDFYPPGGRGSLLESVPTRTAILLKLDQGGVDDIEFSKIGRMDFRGGRVKVTFRDGQVEEGRFANPTDQPVEARFLGITDHYNPASDEVFDFSLPFEKVQEIRFDQ
jgi:hypothetical protein